MMLNQMRKILTYTFALNAAHVFPRNVPGNFYRAFLFDRAITRCFCETTYCRAFSPFRCLFESAIRQFAATIRNSYNRGNMPGGFALSRSRL